MRRLENHRESGAIRECEEDDDANDADDEQERVLLGVGWRRSAVLCSRVGILEASDVIVDVEAVDALPRSMDGRLQLIVAAKGARYLRISLAELRTLQE